jgi:hypothetical protein
MIIKLKFIMDNSHLKYIRWNLNEKNADVHLRCLQALQPLNDSKEIFDQQF